MLFHQAFFGDKNGHGLLASSIDDKSLISQLKPITDLPNGTGFLYPYLSGFRIEDYYVFCYTIQDTTAERRGTVFSHCLILPIKHLDKVNNLSVLMDEFVQTPIKQFTTPLHQINIEENKGFTTEKPDIYDTLLSKLIQNNKSVIYVGYENFEMAIIYLWKYLPHVIRSNFTFTMAASPSDIQHKEYCLIHIPERHRSKWDEYAIVYVPENIEKDGLIDVINGEDDKAAALQQFISDNDIKLSYLYQLKNLLKCYELMQKLEEVSTLRRLVRLIADLFPAANSGIKLKEKVLQKISEQFIYANIIEVKSFANANFESFENGVDIVKKQLEIWANEKIKPKSTLSISELIEVVKKAIAEEKPNWWDYTIRERIQHLSSAITPEIANFFWQFAVDDSIFFTQKINSYIPNNVQSVFVQTFPKRQSNEWYKTIAAFSANRSWWQIYALCNIELYELKKAILLQIEKNNGLADFRSNLLFIAQNTKDTEFVKAAIVIENPTLQNITAEICASSPTLFNHLDVQNPNWQAVWHESFSFTKNISKGITNLKSLFYQLLDLLQKGQYVHQQLLELIENKMDHIFDHPDRAELWAVLPSPIKNRLLEKCGLYLFENSKDLDWNAVEPELMDFMRDERFINSILNKDKRVHYKMKFLEKLSKLDEDYAIKIVEYSSSIEYQEVEYIADKINRNSWKKLLAHFYDNSNRLNYKFIVDKCRDLLTKLQRFLDSLWPSDKEKYKTKQDILNLVDNGNLSKAFGLLNSMCSHDSIYNKIQREYTAKAEGYDYIELCDRLKTYINKLWDDV